MKTPSEIVTLLTATPAEQGIFIFGRHVMQKNVDIYSYAYGNAAGNYHCENGPTVLKPLIEKIDHSNHLHWTSPLLTPHHQQQIAALHDVVNLSEKLAHLTQQSIHNHHFFITLGGDHTAAIGSWSGALNALGDIGLIWFDAHMDAHTFATTPSHNIHGMPVAVLLGYGEKELTQLSKTKLKPENVALIGVRSYESEEANLLKDLGVKIFYMDDINTMGLHAVIQEALAIVTHNTKYFGISIDLDGLDPIDAPGVGSPAVDGIRADDFITEFPAIANHPQLMGVDIVEFNPSLDRDDKTAMIAVELVKQLM